MSYLEELLPEFRKGAKIRRKSWIVGLTGVCKNDDYTFDSYDIDANDWEIVPDEPIDWDYIIKNKCLCWFWDKREDYKMMGTLEKYASLSNISRFIANVYGEENGFCNCLPVRRDEVTFYDDREN